MVAERQAARAVERGLPDRSYATICTAACLTASNVVHSDEKYRDDDRNHCTEAQLNVFAENGVKVLAKVRAISTFAHNL